MDTNTLLVSFSGRIRFNVIENFLNEANKGMTNLNVSLSIRKKILNIMIETLENINKHGLLNKSNVDNIDGYQDKFELQYNNQEFIIKVCNPIPVKQVLLLENKLKRIKTLDFVGLKELYRNVLTNSIVSEEGNVGLGLIDMAIKSNNRINYSFSVINKDIYYYSLEIIVKD